LARLRIFTRRRLPALAYNRFDKEKPNTQNEDKLPPRGNER
jgi:hypothetical protein